MDFLWCAGSYFVFFLVLLWWLLLTVKLLKVQCTVVASLESFHPSFTYFPFAWEKNKYRGGAQCILNFWGDSPFTWPHRRVTSREVCEVMTSLFTFEETAIKTRYPREQGSRKCRDSDVVIVHQHLRHCKWLLIITPPDTHASSCRRHTRVRTSTHFQFLAQPPMSLDRSGY